MVPDMDPGTNHDQHIEGNENKNKNKKHIRKHKSDQLHVDNNNYNNNNRQHKGLEDNTDKMDPTQKQKKLGGNKNKQATTDYKWIGGRTEITKRITGKNVDKATTVKYNARKENNKRKESMEEAIERNKKE